MRELQKGLDISISGPQREEALDRFHGQLETWQLAMPAVEPLVLDFGLEEFYKTGLIECWIANEPQAGYCGKYLFLSDGQTCPSHRHREKKETFCIVKGTVRMTCGDQTEAMGPGSVLNVEPGVFHRFTGKGPALVLEISQPCFIDDNYFENPEIPIGGNYRCDAPDPRP
ncbi:MAG TPA: D-lyxose/D-mannose family sugar isomerase [Sumerlaeia bacterium]|nr:D-lyxose/D-mannose family sugar isomerase [Sumerlaeia bacterium]